MEFRSKRSGGGYGPAGSRTARSLSGSLALASALAAALTVTACSGLASSAGLDGAVSQSGQAVASDPGCSSFESQLSSVSSQISGNQGNTSAEIGVWQTLHDDLQADQRAAQSGVVAGALGDTAAGAENVLVDEQNLMDDPSIGFSQLDSDMSYFESDESALESACGLPG